MTRGTTAAFQDLIMEDVEAGYTDCEGLVAHLLHVSYGNIILRSFRGLA